MTSSDNWITPYQKRINSASIEPNDAPLIYDKKIWQIHNKYIITELTSGLVIIDQQINYLISLKYNFIHYNPFPNVSHTTTKDFIIGKLNKIPSKESKTDIQRLSLKLSKKLLFNQKNYNINSPFYNEVLIIDEVHNFVREIINESRLANIFYQWILNAKDIKLICLSGTPVINKSSEIAILFNMIRGNIQVYNFITDMSDTIQNLESKLKDIFYSDKSPVNQFNISQHFGKYIVSITQNRYNYESILDPIFRKNKNRFSP